MKIAKHCLPILGASVLAFSVSTAKANPCGWNMTTEATDLAVSGSVDSNFLSFVDQNYEFDDAWVTSGWGEPNDGSSGYGRVINSLFMFHENVPAGYTGILSWAEEFLIDNLEVITPSCQQGGEHAIASPALEDELVFFENFFPEGRRTRTHRGFHADSVIQRAATLIHEARHHDGIKHAPSVDSCPTSCDERFSQWGAVAYGISFASASFELDSTSPTGYANRKAPILECPKAQLYINEWLMTHFVEPPNFSSFGELCRGAREDVANSIKISTRFESMARAVENFPSSISETMGYSENSACFLVHISGRFENRSESVEIRQSDVYWALTSSSARTNENERMFAQARCAPTQAPVRVYEFSTGSGLSKFDEVLENEPVASTGCFLTGIRGRLNRSYDFAKVVPSDGFWRILVEREHTGSETELSGSITCADSLEPASSMNVSDGQISLSHMTTANSDIGRVCAISGISGHMDGDKEFVEIGPQGSASGRICSLPDATNWTLEVRDDRLDDSEAVTGWATCFAPDIPDPSSQDCFGWD